MRKAQPRLELNLAKIWKKVLLDIKSYLGQRISARSSFKISIEVELSSFHEKRESLISTNDTFIIKRKGAKTHTCVQIDFWPKSDTELTTNRVKITLTNSQNEDSELFFKDNAIDIDCLKDSRFHRAVASWINSNGESADSNAIEDLKLVYNYTEWFRVP